MLISPVTSFASRVRLEKEALKQQSGRYVINGGDDWYYEPADKKKAETPKTPTTHNPGKEDSKEEQIKNHYYRDWAI